MRTVISTLPYILPFLLRPSHPTDGKQVESLRATQGWEREHPQIHIPFFKARQTGVCQTNSGSRGSKAPTRVTPWKADNSGQVSSFPGQTHCPISLDYENQTQGPKRLQQQSRRIRLQRRSRKADISSSLILVDWLPEQSKRLWIG